MSYTVLARRYRSGTFDEIIGQNHIAQTLKKAIESGRIAHAFLFCGTRGTGKTSTARILAKCLNCEKNGKAGGPAVEPCNRCPSCQAIARGDDIDVIEIDAASNTGVDDVRTMIENAQYHPSRSRFKVYIIDEVHMLSKQAFNALLKTLEEPPAHVKFILATTEAEKVLPTILSRCQRYDFRNIATREIADHLAAICRKEKVEAGEEALALVAKAGAGSMRDALSLLDRLLSVGENKLTGEMVAQLLGMPKSQLIFDLCQAIGDGDVKKMLVGTEDMLLAGQSLDILLASLLDHMRNLLILGTCGSDCKLVEVPGIAIEELARQAQKFEPVVLSQDIVILEELRRNLRRGAGGRALVDATLVRLALAKQFTSLAVLLNRTQEAPAAPQNSGPAVEQKKNLPVNIGAITAPDRAPGDDAPTANDVQGQRRAIAEVFGQEPQAPASPPAPLESGASAFSAAGDTVPSDPAELWRTVLAFLSTNMALHAMLCRSRFQGFEGDMAIVRFQHSDEPMIKMMEGKGKKEALRDALFRVVGKEVGVRFDLDERTAANADAPKAPAEAPPEAKRPAPVTQAPPGTGIPLTAELRAKLQTDPFIKCVMDELGAAIVRVE